MLLAPTADAVPGAAQTTRAPKIASRLAALPKIEGPS